MKEFAGLGLFLLGVITGLSARALLLETAAADMLYYQLLRVPASPLASTLLWWGLPGGALFWCAGYFCGRAKDLCKALAPLGLLLISGLAYPAFWVLPAGIVIAGWAVLRLGSAGFFNGLKLPAVPARTAVGVTALFYLIAVGWGFYTQYHCRETLFLLYNDWGQYFDCYYQWFHRAERNYGLFLVSGLHWNPLPATLMILLMAAFPGLEAETMFAVNALVVYSAIPLLYILARKNNWTPGCALWAAAAGFLSPTLSNQCLSLFYGYHPISFFIPLMIGFFIYKSVGNRRGMIVMFALSLLIQESVPVFWAGYALLLLFERQWRTGIALFAAMVVLFLVLSQQVIPFFEQYDYYPQQFQFAALGSTPLEVLLSPILRPAAFSAALFKPDNFYLLMVLIAPFFFLAPRRADLFLTVGPLLFAIFLQNGGGGVNIVRQYSLEAGVIVIIAAILGAKEKKPGILLCYCAGSTGGGRRGWRRGLAAASIVTLLLGFYVFAKAPFIGKYSFEPLRQQRRHTDALKALITQLKPGETVATTRRTRGWLLGKCPTRYHLELDTNPECAILYLTDKSASEEELQTFRRELHNRGYQPVASRNSTGSQFVLFRRGIEAPALPFLKTIPGEAFDRIGIPLAANLPGFAIRFVPAAQSSEWTFLIKPLDRRVFDVMITVALDFKGQPQIWRGYYAHGVIPAALAPPDQVFILQLPRNLGLGFPSSVTVTLSP
ncbi:MAG: DUF2079 domain-containing protein [Victivallaceae bacterium]